MLTFIDKYSPVKDMHRVIFEDSLWPDCLDVRLSSIAEFGAIGAFSAVGRRILFLDEMIRVVIKC